MSKLHPVIRKELEVATLPSLREAWAMGAIEDLQKQLSRAESEDRKDTLHGRIAYWERVLNLEPHEPLPTHDLGGEG